VANKQLSVDQMVRAGVRPRLAEQAHQAVHTPEHVLVEQKRRELIENLKGAGVSADELLKFLSGRLADRVTIAAGPTIGGAPGPAWKEHGLPGAARAHTQALREILAGIAGEPPGPAKQPFEFEYPGSDAQSRLDLASQITGKTVDAMDLARLTGAPAGSIVRATSYGESNIIISSRSETYNFDGRLVRNPDESLVLEMGTVEVDRSRRRRGVLTDAFSRQLDQARKLGVDRITLIAARNDDPRDRQLGYLVWPKFGFDADLSPARIKTLPAPLAGARTLSDLLSTPEGQNWWRKHGWSIRLDFDMTRGSRSWETWRAYVESKKR
jgi:hypothetical protein